MGSIGGIGKGDKRRRNIEFRLLSRVKGPRAMLRMQTAYGERAQHRESDKTASKNSVLTFRASRRSGGTWLTVDASGVRWDERGA